MEGLLTISYIFPICAALPLGVLIMYFFSKRQLPVQRNRMFTAAIILSCADVVFEFFSAIVVNNSKDIPEVLGTFVLVLFYLLRLSFPVLMSYYAVSITKELKPKNFWSLIAIASPALLVGVIVLFTPATKLFFYYEDGSYFRGEYFILLSLVTAVSAIFSAVYALWKKPLFEGHSFPIVLSFSFLGLASVLIDLVRPDRNVSSVAISTAMLIACLSLTKPESLIDHLTGLLNLDAMMTYTDELISREARYYVIVMKVENIRRINSIFGYTVGSLTLKNIADFLSTFSPDLSERPRLRKNIKLYEGSSASSSESTEKAIGDARRLERTLPPAWAFRLMSNQFAIVSTSESTHEKILQSLHERFEDPWQVRGLEINLMLTVAEMPETGSFASGSDLYKVVELVLPAVPKGDTVTVSERELGKIERLILMETSLEKALEEETLDVRFQPVYNIATGRYDKVEALARFAHEQWGDVPPSEFIPIAEKRGLVTQIDEFVLRKACEFLKDAEDTNVEFVSINISVTEMASSAFPKRACAILDEYGIPYRKIVFEIAEPALMTSIILMLENLTELANLGFGFCLDNMGLGTGDIGRLAVLPFSMVKMDRSVLEEVQTSPKSRIIFENTIDVLKKMEILSVVVGAETSAQVEWILETSPDNIQGFYYARPMDEKGCMAFIRKNNAQTPKKPGRDNFIVVTE